MLLGLDILTYGARWLDALATVRLADALGYDFAFTADHLYATGGDPYEPFFEGWTTLAAWAQATSSIRLGLLVGANPFRNPGIVAKMAVTLDHASGGRAILGLGAAWDEYEQRAHGIDTGRSIGERIDWLDESLEIIGRLLRGETVTHLSDRYQFTGVRHAPLPLQHHMPVLVGATGEKKGLRVVARHADLWQFSIAPESISEFLRLERVLRAHCELVGRDSRAIKRIGGAKVVIRRTREAAARVFDDQAVARGWRGDVLNYILPSVWTGTAADIAVRLQAFADAGLDGFVAQVYPPYDVETIERLAAEVRGVVDPDFTTSTWAGGAEPSDLEPTRAIK
jgi:alkanesulfonate monooxygenase SsuD/methylene tetrahydromethanopterin reductase-like flavin-dependent oxidoreductase (luciferase family)